MTELLIQLVVDPKYLPGFSLHLTSHISQLPHNASQGEGRNLADECNIISSKRVTLGTRGENLPLPYT